MNRPNPKETPRLDQVGARTGFKVIINDQHIATVLRVRRELGIGEGVQVG